MTPASRCPPIEITLIADVVRIEERGKLTILGFLGFSPDVEIAVSRFPGNLALAFVMFGGKATSSFDAAFEVVSSSGQPVIARTPPVEVALTVGKRVGINADTVGVYPGPGDYRIRLFVDDVLHHEAPFALTLLSP